MKNEIRLIALDMDGTLLGQDHATIPARNLAALRAAAERGVEVAIASGRTLSLIQDVARDMDMLRYVIISNGAAVADLRTGARLNGAGLSLKHCREIIRVLRAHDLAYEVFCDGRSYMEERYRSRLAGLDLGAAYERLLGRGISLCADALRELENGGFIEKLHILYVPPSERVELTEALKGTGPLEFANAGPANLELTAPGADKGTALAGLCARLGIPQSAVMAFGDADNDLGMLSWAGWSFAMENGTENAKSAAKYRAAANYDAGVGRAVERYLLTD